jgi:hypothetical protein
VTLTPLPADKALDAYFLEARARLLDLAATFDRIDRGRGDVQSDPRYARLQQALEIIRRTGTDRAEQVQRLFSLEYDPAWKRPTPR